MMSAPDDAATPRTCSNVAKAGSEAAGARDAADVVAIVEAALGELDAGRVNAAKARLGALMATVGGLRAARESRDRCEALADRRQPCRNRSNTAAPAISEPGARERR